MWAVFLGGIREGHSMFTVDIWNIHITNALELSEVYDGAVQHTQQDVEKSIRLMYGMIAKCEEMDEKMQPVHHIAEKVANIKLMLDDLEKCIWFVNIVFIAKKNYFSGILTRTQKKCS